jgi:hypothetical protein
MVYFFGWNKRATSLLRFDEGIASFDNVLKVQIVPVHGFSSVLSNE